MADPDRYTHELAAIEQRVKRRIRRHMIEAVLTGLVVFSLFVSMATPYSSMRYQWQSILFVAICVWIPYTLWYLYQNLVERAVRREIEGERAHQRRLAQEQHAVRRPAARHSYPDHLVAYDDLEDDGYYVDDTGLFADDDSLTGDYPPTEKPKRRLSR